MLKYCAEKSEFQLLKESLMSELTWRTEFLKLSLFLGLNNVKQPNSEHVHLHAHVCAT